MGIFNSDDDNDKKSQLQGATEESSGEFLTTNQGVRISDTDNSLKAGLRGPTLIEDFHFREKMTHFDHERIPERIVHARGAGAHGYFQVYKPLTQLTRAKFLQDPAKKTPVFVRFSTVVGFRGSADTVRDARGFATKFYTEEGNYDLVGNNIPVFFIQDGIKFPDLVHSVKPEPHNEMPQAAAAHDNFWDFISLTTESAHMIMWVLSGHGVPRSYTTMDGFGVHTFRLVNDKGEGRFVKFHWRAVNGAYPLVFDEAQKIGGKDPDFNRRQLWEAIEKGLYPEYELCLQIVDEKDEGRFDFDLLDATKIIPESEVPFVPVGKMVLDRNPDNFFAETEQIAFHPGHVVPGIDVSNDPLLQARLFSYLDTQLIRLGGPNFAELPINRPVAPVHNNQRDGYGRQTINKGRTNYSPNSLGGGCPMHALMKDGGYVHYAEKIEGHKIRQRSPSFADHYGQATLFWNSLAPQERRQLIEAAHFELGKVESKEVRQRVVDRIFSPIDHELAVAVAQGIGVTPPAQAERPNHGRRTAGISLEERKAKSIKGRKIAILAMDGCANEHVMHVRKALENEQALVEVVSQYAGALKTEGGDELAVDKMFSTTSPVLYDAVFVPGGAASIEALAESDYAAEFLSETYRHLKPIGASVDAAGLLAALGIAADADLSLRARKMFNENGVIITRGIGESESAESFEQSFITAVTEHRFWNREPLRKAKRAATARSPEADAPTLRH